MQSEQPSGGNGAAVKLSAVPTATGTERQRMTPASRVEGLGATAVRCLQLAAQALDARRFDTVAAELDKAAAIAPNHPEILRVRGVLNYRIGRTADAIAALEKALSLWPDDALILGNLGSVLADSGRADAALAIFRRACAVAPGVAASWFNLGKQLEAQNEITEARQALERAVAIAPDHVSARILLGEVLNMLGHTEQAAAEFRRVLKANPGASRAWIGLANLKTIPLGDDEFAALQRAHAAMERDSEDRMIAGFALGKALEDRECYEDAFAALAEANAEKRRTLPWDANAHSRHIDAIASAAADAETRLADETLGHEVIFVVGLPRSGSTLVEQILAAHPDVEGASELNDLEAVLGEESRRRNQPFPRWVPSATAAEWQRLGKQYLERTARWRTTRPRFTDKRPENWALVGAALTMLPGARVIDCRRNAVETCWSCYKQLFGPHRLPPAYDLADIAQYSRDHDRLAQVWQRLHGKNFREQRYEDLIADPDTQIRALLDFCGLSFDPACLDFHQADRAVRTASAAQVRQPLRADTARSARYGDLLNPLRDALAAES